MSEAKQDAEHWASMLADHLQNILDGIEGDKFDSAMATVVEVHEVVTRLDKALEEASGVVDGE